MKLDLVIVPRQSLYGIERCPVCRERMRFIGVEPHPTSRTLEIFSDRCSCGEDLVTTMSSQ